MRCSCGSTELCMMGSGVCVSGRGGYISRVRLLGADPLCQSISGHVVHEPLDLKLRLWNAFGTAGLLFESSGFWCLSIKKKKLSLMTAT